MLIDCDSCAVRDLACGDCVVTVLLGMPGPATIPHPVAQQGPEVVEAGHVTRVELGNPERAAIAVLAAHGLVPPLRLVPKDPGGPGDGPQTDTAGPDEQAAAG